MGERMLLLCFIRGVMRNKIEMSYVSLKKSLAIEVLCLFDSFFYTGVSNMNRAADTFISSLRRSLRGGNWDVNMTAFSKCTESIGV